MRKLITAALLTASFAATAEDRGAYVLHKQSGETTTQIAIFYMRVKHKDLADGFWPLQDSADINRGGCQAVARILNKIKEAEKPEGKPSPWWCEAE